MKILYILIFLSITTLAESRDSLYIQFSGDTVKIWNSTTLNCCSQIRFDVRIKEYFILLVETDTSKSLCRCLCDFELCASLTGLPIGQYNVSVMRANEEHDTTVVGEIQFEKTSEARPAVVQFSGYQSQCLAGHKEVTVYFNSFETPQDTIGWHGHGGLEFSDEAAPEGGNKSAYVSGGCLIPHARYVLPPFEEDGYYILRCWGKIIENYGWAVMYVEENGDVVQIVIYEKEKNWKYYQSIYSLFCPAGKSITLEVGAGGFIPGAMLIDEIEIVKVSGSSSLPTNLNDQWDKEIKNPELFQNYPNPFNPVTKIKYAVPHMGINEYGPQRVQIKVYDLLGKLIEVLVDKYQYPGYYEVEFNGSRLPSAIYFYSLNAGNKSINRKMSLIK